jgi:hypothetical protein
MMANPVDQERFVSDRPYPPSFTGLLLHREPRLGYSFFVPNGWYRQDVEGAEGVAVMYIPSPDDLLTGFSVEGRDLGLEVSADDFPALRAGFLSGLRKMNHSRIESHVTPFVMVAPPASAGFACSIKGQSRSASLLRGARKRNSTTGCRCSSSRCAPFASATGASTWEFRLMIGW